MNKLKQNKTILFFLVVAFQVFVILGMVGYKLTILGDGVEVALRIQPVDPRDPLRGDYAIFEYEISDISSYMVNPGETVYEGDEVYVTLRTSGKYWIVKEVYKNKPTNSEEVFIKGRVMSGPSNSGRFRDTDFMGSEITTLRVQYGIEQYWIGEGKGRNLWELMGTCPRSFSGRCSEHYALVHVNPSGEAILKQIYINDKPWP